MLSFLYPPVCPLCQKEILEKGQNLCKKCREKDIFLHEPLCFCCGKPLDHKEEEYCQDCRKHPKKFIRNIGLCVDEEPVKSSLSAVKDKNKREYAGFYIEEMKRRRGRQLKSIHPDIIVPVPMHARKRRKRGFNQAEIFAAGIAEITGCPMEPRLVKRVHDTKPQKNLNPEQRKKNLSHAFQGEKEIYHRLGRPGRILIVDDIYTTGATMQGVAQALLRMGAKEIYACCIAVGRGFS